MREYTREGVREYNHVMKYLSKRMYKMHRECNAQRVKCIERATYLAILKNTCLSLYVLLPLDTSSLPSSLVERCGERKVEKGKQSWCAMHSCCRVLVLCICLHWFE